MARLARLTVGGFPHLVVQRSGSRVLFADDADAGRLLETLQSAAAEARVALHGYALLPHGLWLLVTPAEAEGVGRTMQAIGRRYVRWINDRRGERGGLFAGRYRAALLEADAQLLEALRFVEWQPALAGLAQSPEDYRWSSCRHHVGLVADPRVRVHPLYWALGNTPFERQAAYRAWLGAGPGPDCVERFEHALAGGWVLGSAEFVRQIEHLCPRRPQRARAGRPRRAVPVPP
jgi:putative transposase